MTYERWVYTRDLTAAEVSIEVREAVRHFKRHGVMPPYGLSVASDVRTVCEEGVRRLPVTVFAREEEDDDGRMVLYEIVAP